MNSIKAKNKLNLEDYLFHGIKPWCFKTWNEYRQDMSEILKSILEVGYIASRKHLQEILSEGQYTSLQKFKFTNWNGENCVSITPYLSIAQRDYDWLDIDSTQFAYNSYIKNYPAIVLDRRLLKELTQFYGYYQAMPGEIQIEDKIPIDYFVGITLPNIDFEKSLEYIENNLIYKRELDWDSWNYRVIQNLLNMKEEEFVSKYYQDVIAFENVLKEMNSNFSLYHTETGEKIASFEEEIEISKKLKKKVLMHYSNRKFFNEEQNF